MTMKVCEFCNTINKAYTENAKCGNCNAPLNDANQIAIRFRGQASTLKNAISCYERLGLTDQYLQRQYEFAAAKAEEFENKHKAQRGWA